MKIYEPFFRYRPAASTDAAVTRGRPAANLFSELCFRNGDSIMDICTFKTILFYKIFSVQKFDIRDSRTGQLVLSQFEDGMGSDEA